MKPKLVFIDSEGHRTYDVVDTGTEEQLEALADAKNEALEARGNVADWGVWVALPD